MTVRGFKTARVASASPAPAAVLVPPESGGRGQPYIEIAPAAAVIMIRAMLMTRAGEVIDEAVADERARNIVSCLQGSTILT